MLTARLEAAYHHALQSSLSFFKALHSSTTSTAWKPVSLPQPTQKRNKQTTGLAKVDLADVAVHRRSGKHGDVYRATVDVDCGSDISVDTFRGCLATPETRPLCESSTVMHLQTGLTSFRKGTVWSKRLSRSTCWMHTRG